MCGRYTVIDDDDIAELREIIPAYRGHIPEGSPLFGATVSPGMTAPILTQHGDLLAAHWGFRLADKKLSFNARSEGLDTNQLYSPHLAFGRIVAPARCYYEWTPADPQNLKLKFTIAPDKKRRPTFYLCGLMRPNGDRFEYTIITRPAIDKLAFIHPRMPLIVDPNGAREWLVSRETLLPTPLESSLLTAVQSD